MTKDQLIDAIKTAANFTRADAEKAVEAFIEQTTEGLKNGGPVDLEGFGEFTVVMEGNGDQEKVVKFEPGNDLSRTIK